MEDTKTYELGLLLTPLLTPEGAAGFLDGALKQVFERQGIQLTSADTPKMIPLAYTIRKRIDNKNQVFREAHFVSLRFSGMPEAIPALTTELRKASEVVRFLVITIPKVTEVVERRPAATRPAAKTAPEEQSSETAAEASKTDKKEVIDREIDDLLAATAATN